MNKYGFAIKTRDGLAVDNIVIAGSDRDDAERKLRQMYRQCQITRCAQAPTHRESRFSHTPDIEEILSLIVR